MLKKWCLLASIVFGAQGLEAMEGAPAQNQRELMMPGARREFERAEVCGQSFLMGLSVGFVEGSAISIKQRELAEDANFYAFVKGVAITCGPGNLLLSRDYTGAVFSFLPLVIGWAIGYNTGRFAGTAFITEGKSPYKVS